MSLTWSLALRAVRGRPLRSALTALAVALGIAIVLGVAVTVTGLGTESRAAAAAAAGSSDLDVRVTAGTGLGAGQVQRLGHIAGVESAVPLYAKRVVARISPADVDGTTVNVLAMRGGAVALRPVSLASGTLPSASSRSEVVVDQGLAVAMAANERHAPLLIGDTIELTTATGPDTFTIVGFSDGGGLGGYTRSGVFVTEAAMLDEFRLGLRTAMVAIHLAPGADAGRVAAAARAIVGAAATVVDARQQQGSPLGEVGPLLLLVTVLSVTVGAGSAANSVALAASERRRELALLRAAGASARAVFRLFVVEVAVIATAAAPLGVAAGVGLAAFLEAHLTPADLPVPGLDVGWAEALAAVVVGVAAALAGGAAAAVIACRRPPLAGLRPHPGADRERLGAFPIALAPPALVAGALLFASGDGTAAAVGTVVVVAGVICALPLVAPWAARFVGLIATALTPRAGAATRNLVRRRNRTALTLAGLTISIASAVAVSALATGAISGGDSWVSGLFSGNVLVRGPVAQTDAVEASIASTPGVRQALPLRFLSVASGTSMLGVTTVDTAAYEQGGGIDVLNPDRSDAFRTIGNGAAVLVPASLAAARDWMVGRSVPLITRRGTVPFLVAGIVQHSFPAGNGEESLIMDRAEAQQYFGDTATGFDDLDVATTGNPAAVMGSAALFGLSAVTLDDIRASAERSLQHALGLLGAVAILALVMSMITVVNTLLVNIRQGSRELSMMRAVGLDRHGARRLVLTEAALLAATGTALGVATGCAIVVGMLRAVSSPGFSPAFTFPLVAAIALAATIVGGSLIAALGPATRVARASIVGAIRQD